VASAGAAQAEREAAGGEPRIEPAPEAGGRRIALSGDWTMQNGGLIERAVSAITYTQAETITLDVSGLGRLDTLGAMMIARLRASGEGAGAKVSVGGGSATHRLTSAAPCTASARIWWAASAFSAASSRRWAA
jgi:hypothetical protein